LPQEQLLALMFRELVIYEQRRSCGLPSAQLCGVVCLWQRDELFQAQWYVFVE
jgi:hypothetical protein